MCWQIKAWSSHSLLCSRRVCVCVMRWIEEEGWRERGSKNRRSQHWAKSQTLWGENGGVPCTVCWEWGFEYWATERWEISPEALCCETEITAFPSLLYRMSYATLSRLLTTHEYQGDIVTGSDESSVALKILGRFFQNLILNLFIYLTYSWYYHIFEVKPIRRKGSSSPEVLLWQTCI